MTSPSALSARVYERLPERADRARTALGRPLTLAEKVLVNHLRNAETIPSLERGRSSADFDPDGGARQAAPAQIVVLQFMSAGLTRVELPTTVHCDHLIQARTDARADLANALDANSEVYEFLRTACAKYGIGFWPPGSG